MSTQVSFDKLCGDIRAFEDDLDILSCGLIAESASRERSPLGGRLVETGGIDSQSDEVEVSFDVDTVETMSSVLRSLFVIA